MNNFFLFKILIKTHLNVDQISYEIIFSQENDDKKVNNIIYPETKRKKYIILMSQTGYLLQEIS